MSDPLWINVNAGAPEYNAQELRRAQAMFLASGVADRFGARGGVRPTGSTIASITGTTWTVQNLNAVVYPGITSLSGPYVVQHPQEAGATTAADGTNPRIDALDLQIQDDDEDASGERRARIVYVNGTPAGSPVAPAATANSLRIATILVPAGGAPSPSLTVVAPFTTALGGILPAATSAALPAAGRYEGMYADQADTDALRRWNGSAWEDVASAAVHSGAAVTLDTFDGGAGTNVTTIFSGIDQTFAHLVIYWRGRNDAANAAATLSIRFNDDGASNYWSEQARTSGAAWAHNANANTTSIRVGFTGSQNATHGKVFIPWYSNLGGFVPTKSAHGESHSRGVDGSSTGNSYGVGAGYWTSTAAITSIQMWPAGQLWNSNVRATLIGIRE